jgi:NADPH:quinone reductase-like Zn-dependent oxidoreductase
MRAVRYQRYGGPERLRLVDQPTPTPSPGDVLVRTRAASVNSWDWDLLRADDL